jgi:hypothetical protein
LSEEERGGVKIGGGGSRVLRVAETQAVGKVLAEKQVAPEILERTLGRVWCPMKGVVCKDLGENFFLFTFMQVSGKRRALEDGPWVILKDLVIMVDFDETKTLEEMEFNMIPIWVQVSNLPFCMMDKDTGAKLREKIGVFKEVDVGEDGFAIGRVLRIKVLIDICKPLMRGMMVKVGVEEKEKWCPFAYEFLPDFCYTCGLIGHIDKLCATRVKPGEMQQFFRSLRYILEKKKTEGSEERRPSEVKYRGQWYGGGAASRGFHESRHDRWASAGSGSDALTWRKRGGGEETEKGEEVMCLEKNAKKQGRGNGTG